MFENRGGYPPRFFHYLGLRKINFCESYLRLLTLHDTNPEADREKLIAKYNETYH